LPEIRVTVAIPTLTAGPKLSDCVQSLAEQTCRDFAVVVVDNSGEKLARQRIEASQSFEVIENDRNRGFGAAVNQGFTVLNSTYVLLLNPDVVIRSGLDPLREACDLPGSAGAGGQLMGSDGRPQSGFMVRALPTPAALILEVLLLNRAWPNNPVNRRYRVLGKDYSKRFKVGQPAGAFLLLRRTIWQELEGFDEGFYPVWFEDVDFCRRIQQRGLDLYYVPEAVAKHTGGHSIPWLGVEMRRVYWYRSLLRYSAKHFSRGAFAAVCAAVCLGSALRGIAESVLHRSFRPIATYGKVLRHAGHCMLFGFRP